ncbi:30S ribosomal protein S1 [Hydrogenimonas thermophila]|uniref:Small subunit ribosomal protein S1 n=1 Tax=Hydrogenimonas thermophila TaxID=223786 RepID=A0A1I5QSI6_9BACT|nr:30S ribosomal protein S1 [Hydrogenimonas thermophila]WOE69329.1 30S ribosomal protein S1 [Hydrogenimonas thermophila]SFP49215.1 small subunit ribosomal protein S1 [Hydrogenimonas thermophila]
MDKASMEEFDNMEEDFASMLDAYEKKEQGGTISDGVIVEVRESDNQALVDVGRKQEAAVNLDELKDENGNLKFNVGDAIPVVITGYRNERPQASYLKAVRKANIRKFIEEHENDAENMVVEGKVVRKNRGGYFVIGKDNIEFFMPMSQAAFAAGKNPVGKEIKAVVLKLDKDRDSIVISRRKYLDQIRKERKEIVDRLMQDDKIVEGTIKKITSYGMFVDVGGIEGLVHYSEISYKGPVNPATLYEEGDKVEVKAIGYDPKKRHLSLSIKQTMPDPWEEIIDQLEEGDAIKVIVSNIEPYGAFVDLGNDIEGFLHVSEVSWDKDIKNPKDYLSVGDEIDVEVIEINPEARRLRVSYKNLQPKPFEDFLQSQKEGDVVKGVITTITDFGAFVKIGKVEGLLHNQDASWDKGVKVKDIMKKGDEVEVKIIKIDPEQERISLSKKALEESPIDRFAKEHKVGDIVKGKIRDIKDFGVFVELQDGVDALIRKEDVSPLKIDELNKGDEIEGVIVMLDPSSNKIRLSVRRLERQKEREALNEFNNSDDRLTIGDIIKDQL